MPAESDNFSPGTTESDAASSDGASGATSVEEPQGVVAPELRRSELVHQAVALLEQAAACEQEIYDNAEQAAAAAQQVERARRLAFTVAVNTLHDMSESRVCDEHGHSSAKAMYVAVNGQSSRDIYGLEQVRRMFNKSVLILKAGRKGSLSESHLRLLARVYANRRVRARFLNQQAWFIRKACRFDFKRFEILVERWLQVNDEDGPDPNQGHENRTASSVQDFVSLAFQFSSTQSSLVGAEMDAIFRAYFEAETAKDWEDARAIHGDAACKDDLARTDAQRRADAVAQIFRDAAANPNSSMPATFVHNIVMAESTHTEMCRRLVGMAPRPFDLDDFRCETIDGIPLEVNEAFFDSLISPFRRVVMDAKGVVIDISEKRFFTGLARTALQIANTGCQWPGCNVPATRCQADHIHRRSSGGETTQVNGTCFCGRHNRHKERGYTVWRDPTSGQIRIKAPSGYEVTKPWQLQG